MAVPPTGAGAKRVRADTGKTVRSGKSEPPTKSRRSVIMQARIEGAFAQTLLERDAVVLGLEGPSDLVREGLRLVHRRAQEQAMADSYDAFYGSKPAPLPAGVHAAGG